VIYLYVLMAILVRRVAGNMMESYYGDDLQKRKSNLVNSYHALTKIVS
jgi:hypothetical protein